MSGFDDFLKTKAALEYNKAAFIGLNVYESPWCVRDGEPREVPRTWKERLLTRPWRPWRATRWEVPKIPTMLVAGNMLVIHPALIRDLKASGVLDAHAELRLPNDARHGIINTPE